MKTTFIYALCEPGTRTVRYIGKADDVKRRFLDHLRTSSKVSTPLGAWLRGLFSVGEKPNLVVLREVPVEQWKLAEERYIRLARGCGIDLVNSNKGGAGPTSHTQEACAKISAAISGEKNPNFGKVLGPLSPETCAKISVATSGEKNHMFGKSHTPEAKAKNSAAHLGEKNYWFGKTHAPESCAKMSAANSGENHPMFGKHRTPETRAKISSSTLGKKLGEENPMFGKEHTPESNAKRSASLRASWSRRKEREQEIEWALAPYTLE